MEQIQTLSTLRGREVIRDVFRELRFERQIGSPSVIRICWRLCVYERDIYRFSKQEVTVLHPLGLFAGTSLWLQEIINRFYFSTINSLVYFGAAILLVIIGLRRFTTLVGNELVIGSILLEALLLLLLFMIMFFSPLEDIEATQPDSKSEEETEAQQLIREVGEISSDYAAIASQMDEVTSTLSGLLARQDEIIVSVNEIARAVAQAVSPEPEMIIIMKQTNEVLQGFTETVQQLSDAARLLRREEIQQAVRYEVERILSNHIPPVE